MKNKSKKVKNLGQVMNDLLNAKATKNSILSKKKIELKKIEKEEIEYKELKKKKLETKLQRLLGYKEGIEWDKKKEKNLIKTATRGVVKLFNSIYEFKKKSEEKVEENSNIKL
jgi:hypothetical protein